MSQLGHFALVLRALPFALRFIELAVGVPLPTGRLFTSLGRAIRALPKLKSSIRWLDPSPPGFDDGRLLCLS